MISRITFMQMFLGKPFNIDLHFVDHEIMTKPFFSLTEKCRYTVLQHSLIIT